MTTLGTSTDRAAGLCSGSSDSVEELGRSAARRFDEAIDQTGDALHSAASSVRKTVRKGSEAIDNLAASTADGLDATASYIEDHHAGDVLNRVRKFARQHPARSLLAAVAIGFLAGSTISRVTHSR